jgi:hypothetical protein
VAGVDRWSDPVIPRGANSTYDSFQLSCSDEEHMREQNLIEATPDQEVSRFIQYLDPDIQEVEQTIWRHHDFDGLVTLVLLLGGVIVCFAVLFIHIAE